MARFRNSLVHQPEIDFGLFWPMSFDGEDRMGEDQIWALAQFPDGPEFTNPIAEYRLNSGIDKSFPNGFSGYAPHEWFRDSLDLVMSDEGPKAWMSKGGNPVIQTKEIMSKQAAVVIDAKFLHSFTERSGIEPVWIMIAERNVFANSHSEAHRRLEGIFWLDGVSWKGVARDLGNIPIESNPRSWFDLPVSFHMPRECQQEDYG